MVIQMLSSLSLACLLYTSNMVLRTFPSKVAVRFTIGASLFRTIKPSQFKVVVDYKLLIIISSLLFQQIIYRFQFEMRLAHRARHAAQLELALVRRVVNQIVIILSLIHISSIFFSSFSNLLRYISPAMVRPNGKAIQMPRMPKPQGKPRV